MSETEILSDSQDVALIALNIEKAGRIYFSLVLYFVLFLEIKMQKNEEKCVNRHMSMTVRVVYRGRIKTSNFPFYGFSSRTRTAHGHMLRKKFNFSENFITATYRNLGTRSMSKKIFFYK